MEYKFLTRDSFVNYMKEFGELYTLCFNVPMDEAEVEWRYLGNTDSEILSCIALDKGKLVANYSASPICLFRNGEVIKSAQSLNTMTHPEYMGQGLFVKLASDVYQYMSDNGYKMIMGFPNNISNRTFLTKLGWKDISVVPTLELDLNLVRKKEISRKVEILQDDEFELDYSRCCISSENVISVYKTKEYLKWRYAQCPAAKYYVFVILAANQCVSSRIILKEFRNRINVVDAYFSNADEQKALLNYAIDFGKINNKDLLTIWAKLGSDEHLILESYGAKLSCPVTYFGGRILDMTDSRTDFYRPENWFLNMSDDNVY